MKRIVLTGGGTAGHVSANLALLPRLLESGFDVHYIGTADGIEHSLVSALPNVAYHAISAGKLRRYLDLKNLSDPFRVAKGTLQARSILNRLKPDVVFSKGGFVAVPVMLAAKMLNIPAVAHESDLTPGLANRIAGKFARHICTSFEQTARLIGPKAVYTGSPVREELFSGSASAGRKLCGFPQSKPVLLAMGGSQGARAINDALRAALPELTRRYCVAHLCGRGNASGGKIPDYFELEYAKAELPDLIQAADIAVSRAGANSLFELLALRKPALLIPLPLSSSRGDQIDNAKAFAEKGYAHTLLQEELTPERLVREIDALYRDRAACVRAMAAGAPENGTEKVLHVILSCVSRQGEERCRF